ncbi:FG-GAP-like repeat-containing protein [Microbulbifer spongiae]|uniref:FG-GAP-like repeat-containing protein n=1 Tax=Microbulbifer spongiae TaxID=2944933 RepID=A0ABY9EDF2_9GAMM|nr:FG-GAP-like repeat-containing protein [Microbulbifer sp. MI-G]WKD50396.1 FG-GAP-like repeat-containing protein [Microbulbifer sp. MI-G]
MRSVVACLCVLFFAISSATVNATTGIWDNGYEIYRGDINGDGREDLYFEYHRPIILLHGEVVTPILMPDLPDFVLHGIGVGGVQSYFGPIATTLDESIVSGLERLSSNLSLTGDFNGDGDLDLLVLGTIPLIFHANGNGLPSLAQQFHSAFPEDTDDVKAILSQADPDTVTIKDVNGDGRDDILVGGSIGVTLPANASGIFTSFNTIVEPNIAGASGGQFRVNEAGAVTYNFPIATATGTAGVVPEVSINYNSNGGNGLLGKGWAIGGLSGISRCRQTLAIDGAVAPINWTESDRFCLDGQRLIKTGGSQYGAVGATYKTELDSYAKIISVGGSLGKPAYFRVERKDGSTSYYGNSGDSKQLAGSHALVWALNRFEDSVGNPIEFQYEGDANSGHRIREIRYAYGAGSHAAKIEFIYENRSDSLRGYTAGYEFKTTKRLKSIVSSSSGSVIREYTLGYKPTTDYESGSYTDRASLLFFIQECVGSSCLPAVSFEWSGSSVAYSEFQEAIDFKPASDRFLVKHLYADFNGDGLQDIVWVEGDLNKAKTDTDTRVKYAISDGTKFVRQSFSGNNFSREYFTDTDADEIFDIRVLDYNGDGRQDLAIYNSRNEYGYNKNEWHIFLSRYSNGAWRLSSGNPIRTGLTSKNALFVDFDSDGLPDYISAVQGQTSVRLLQPGGTVSSDRYYRFSSTAQSYPTSPVLDPNIRLGAMPNTLGDFNGDGAMDLLISRYEYTYECRDEGFPSPIDVICTDEIGNSESIFRGYEVVTLDSKLGVYTSLATLHTGMKDRDPIAVEINGDGLTDIAYWTSSNNLRIELSTGTGFTRLGSFAVNEKATFADLNNDGYQDLVWPDFSSSTIKTHYFDQNTGGFVGAAEDWRPIGNDDNDSVWFADVNGDGQIDYHSYHAFSGRVLTFLANASDENRQDQPSNVIQEIDNGLGNITKISYGNMIGSGVYSRLEMATSTEEKCVIYPGDLRDGTPYLEPTGDGPRRICYPVTTGDTAAFYTALNGGWMLPEGSQTLGKGQPVLDILAPRYLVSRVESSAPAAGLNPGAVSWSALSSVSYHYEQMKLQAAGRGMLGFQSISTTDNQTGVVTETTYRQDFPFIGMPLHTETRTGSGKILSRAANTWHLQGWSGTGTPAAPYRPYIHRSIEETYDLKTDGSSQGDLVQSVTTTNSYDHYGNALTINVVTTDPATGDQFVKNTVNTYGTSTWEREMGRLSNTQVTSTRPGMANHVRESAFTYYPSGIRRGLLKTEVIEPNRPQYQQTTAYEYDDFGNVVKQTLSAPGETSRSARTVYDPSGRYMEESYNALNHRTEKVVSRNHFGAPLMVEGLNGLKSYFVYDVLGREIESSNNAGADKQTEYGRCTSGCPAGARYKVTTSSSTGSWGREYFDALGRVIRTETQGLHKTIYSDREYDNLGRLKFVSEPYFIGNSRLWTKTDYDLLGRPTRVLAPDSSQATMEYLGLKTITTNDKGQEKTERKNVAGELVEVTDAIDGRLTYEYDSQGNLHKAKSIFRDKTNSTDSHTAEGGLNNSNVIPPPTGEPVPPPLEVFPTIVVVTINYDHLGRKTSMDDPDKGAWEYTYTGYGELKQQTNANGHTVEFTYDQLGRQLTRIEKRGGIATTSNVGWYYDSAANGLGQVEMVTDSVSGYQALYQYDQLGRNDTQLVDFDGDGPQPSYVTTTVFDGHGRVERSYDALDSLLGSGQSGIRNYYNGNGYLYKVVDLATGDLIEEIKAQTARGQLKEQLLGNGATTTFNYQGSTGRLLNQTSTVLGAFGIQNIGYQWDTLGNLTSRHNRSGSKNLRESFCYDDLNRLIKTHIGSNDINCSSLYSGQQDVRYNAIGNITYKAGVGNYVYGQNGAGPHAVTTAGGVSYHYDANGNMTSDGFDGGRTIDYTTFDKAERIEKGNHTTEFLYGPSHSRYYRKDTNSSSGEVTETWYIGGIERIQNSNAPNEIQWKRHLGVAVYTVKTDLAYAVQSTDKLFLYKDHLGSMDLITDKAGKVVQEMSFDAWGQRRNTANWSALTLTALYGFDHSHTTRGYTGHEMLDEVGLIHMNGRIYDPRLGRFMQADPFIQAAADTQMYNRYSYVRNNPLNATDPSGYFIFTLAAIINTALVTAKVISLTQGIIAAFVIGFAGAVAAGGSLGDALISGISGAAFTALGGANFADTALAAILTETGVRVLAFGALGGITSILQGGKFGHGFAAAGLGAAAGSIPGLGGKGPGAILKRAVVGAVVGGTSTKITGGKFANGAATGAFVSILQTGVKAAVDSTNEVTNRKFDAEDLTKRQAVAEELVEELYKEKILRVDQRFKKLDALVDYLAPHMNGITRKTGLEVGGWIYRDAGGLGYTRPIVGFERPLGPAYGGGFISSVYLGEKADVILPKGGTLTATWHTHPSNSTFSISDINNAVERELDHHVFTQSGEIYRRLWSQNKTCITNAQFSLKSSTDGHNILSCGSY